MSSTWKLSFVNLFFLSFLLSVLLCLFICLTSLSLLLLLLFLRSNRNVESKKALTVHPADSKKTKATTATSARLIHSASGTCLVLNTKTRGRTSHHCSFSTSLILRHLSYFSFFLLSPSSFSSFNSYTSS